MLRSLSHACRERDSCALEQRDSCVTLNTKVDAVSKVRRKWPPWPTNSFLFEKNKYKN